MALLQFLFRLAVGKHAMVFGPTAHDRRHGQGQAQGDQAQNPPGFAPAEIVHEEGGHRLNHDAGKRDSHRGQRHRPAAAFDEPFSQRDTDHQTADHGAAGGENDAVQQQPLRQCLDQAQSVQGHRHQQSAGKNEWPAAPPVDPRADHEAGECNHELPDRPRGAEFGPGPAELVVHRHHEGPGDIVRHAHGNELRNQTGNDDPIPVVNALTFHVPTLPERCGNSSASCTQPSDHHKVLAPGGFDCGGGNGLIESNEATCIFRRQRQQVNIR